jgi:hypothetical protein
MPRLPMGEGTWHWFASSAVDIGISLNEPSLPYQRVIGPHLTAKGLRPPLVLGDDALEVLAAGGAEELRASAVDVIGARSIVYRRADLDKL